MPDTPLPASDSCRRFFNRHLICLDKASVPERQRRWYVRRIEEFIKAQKGHKIKQLTATKIVHYLEMPGRQDRLRGWQYRQCVHAIRILYCDLFASTACREVDWQYWLDSASQFGADHDTTGRERFPEELTRLKERRGEGPLQQVRAAHSRTPGQWQQGPLRSTS